MDNIASDSENKILNIKKQQYSKPNFNWKDPLNLEDLLTEEEKLIRNTASDYAQEKLMPRVEEAFLDELTDKKIFREMEVRFVGYNNSRKIWVCRSFICFIWFSGKGS